jgi:hypothetical protein
MGTFDFKAPEEISEETSRCSDRVIARCGMRFPFTAKSARTA